MLEDQLAIVSGCGARPIGETFSYEGKHHSVQNSPGLPKPVQHESHSFGPPIVMGGWGREAHAALAAKHAAEYNLPFSPVANVPEQFDRVRGACDAVGRDPVDAVAVGGGRRVLRRGRGSVRRRRAEAIGQDPNGLRANQLGGTTDEVTAARPPAYRDAGAQRLYLQVLDLHDLEHLRPVGGDVARRVTSGGAGSDGWGCRRLDVASVRGARITTWLEEVAAWRGSHMFADVSSGLRRSTSPLSTIQVTSRRRPGDDRVSTGEAQQLDRMPAVDHAHERRMDAVADEFLQPWCKGTRASVPIAIMKFSCCRAHAGAVLDRHAQPTTARRVGTAGMHERSRIDEH